MTIRPVTGTLVIFQAAGYYVYGGRTNKTRIQTNSVVAIITVLVGIASAAVAAMFPAAGTITCLLCLR